MVYSQCNSQWSFYMAGCKRRELGRGWSILFAGQLFLGYCFCIDESFQLLATRHTLAISYAAGRGASTVPAFYRHDDEFYGE